VKIVSSDVEPGWASSTMQSSVMFFLISICLYLLIEYLTNLLESLTSEVDVPIRSEFNQQKHVDQLNVKEIRYEV
jgi:hypothetical protein